MTLPIAPGDLAERNALRGCRNCAAYDGRHCRGSSPGPQGWPEVAPTDWCLSWAWAVNPRVVWNSAIAPREREQLQQEESAI